MADERTGFNEAIAIWAVVAGAVLAGAITALFAIVPVWGWVALSSLVLLSGVALLSFSDPASQNFLAGTLRHRTYTQIYTTLTRRLMMRIWAALCDELGDPKKMEREEISVARLFHHALTWRLYDKALLIAVAYPILLLVGQWVVTGEDARIGGFEFLPAAPFWWDRAAVVGALAILILGFVARKFAAARRHRVVRQAAGWLPYLAFAVAFAIAGAVAAAVAFAIAGAGAGASAGAIAGAVALALAVAVEAAGALAAAVTAAVAVAGAIAVTVAVEWLDKKGHSRFGRWVLTVAVLFAVVAFVSALDFQNIPEDRRSLFVFLAVFPLLNALFDTVSYAVTLTLTRRGLRSAAPWLWGLIDLAIASVLFLALGCTLVAVIHGLNGLAGVPLIDLPALLAGVHDTPGDYVWLYLMLFSTILPTALHGILSLLGVQGLWPRVWRRPVAAWVESATASSLAYLRAGLALGVIWTIPLMLLGTIVWGLWAIGGGAITWALGQYFDALLWLAAIPVGAI